MMEMPAQFWLVKLDQHDNPTLNDGPHSDRAGVEQALYLHTALGFNRGAKYGCAKIEITEVEANASDVNHKAINALNAIGLRP
jgi:hypothetical protein